MPSLISRILGKKKTPGSSNLLDGEKYEAVTSSPSPPLSQPAQRSKSPSKRRKNAGNDSKVSALPVLSLTLPDTKLEEKKSHGLGVVFEGITDAPSVLDDGTLAAKRLTPGEALYLVQKTSEVIFERGLETLGVMRPHWFASPRQQEIQQKLLSRFLQTLPSSQYPEGSGSTPSSPAPFESELRYTRDPHDVAAVLRWGLRHLQLAGDSFASSSSSDWYRSFSESERSGSYPPKAFDDILVPLLPEPHTRLLRAILDLVSSLAAHSEENGISGNKLSKVLGWWIISSRTVQGSGWREFYREWEASARQFEHVFLAYIRAQEAHSRMPKRLTELVKNYPFSKNRHEDDGIFLPRSRFSTRSADALFIKVTVYTERKSNSSIYPLYIVEDAFKANPGDEAMGEYGAFWRELRDIATVKKTLEHEKEPSENVESDSLTPSYNLSAVLADESIRLLSLVPPPADDPNALSLLTPHSTRARRSFSVGERSPNTNGFHKDISTSSPPRSPATSTRDLQTDLPTTDWQAFTSTGFQSSLSPGPQSPSASGLSLAASLWDNDTEVTTPKKISGPARRLSSLRSPSPRRVSVESQPPISPQRSPTQLTTKPSLKMTYSRPQLVKLDEAFVDFWSDTLLDSVTSTDAWPAFVLCQLKPRNMADKKVEWLIIERTVQETKKQVGVEKVEVRKNEGAKTRLGSTSGKKRWTLFGGGKKVTGRVSEMGEVVREEEEEEKKVNKAKMINGQESKKSWTSTRSKGKDSKDTTTPPVPQPAVTAPKSEAETVVASATVPTAVAEETPTAVTVEQTSAPIVAEEPKEAPAPVSVEDTSAGAGVGETTTGEVPAPVVEKPVIEHAPEPVIESAPEPVIESAPEPVIESAPEPVIESAPEPVIESAPERIVEPEPTPAPDDIVETAPSPAVEAEAVAETTPEPVTESVPEPVAEVTPEPVVELAPELLPISAPEPVAERVSTPPPRERAPTPQPQPEEHVPEPAVTPAIEPEAVPEPEPAENTPAHAEEISSPTVLEEPPVTTETPVSTSVESPTLASAVAEEPIAVDNNSADTIRSANIEPKPTPQTETFDTAKIPEEASQESYP